jgi:hypothetical protein
MVKAAAGLPHSKKGLEHKKRGARERAPRFVWGVRGLEKELESELELTHANRSTRSRIGLNVRDLASVAATIDTGVALIGVEAQHWMVEQVVGIEAELGLDALCNSEGLGKRHIIVERMRTAIRIVAYISDLSATRKSKHAGAWSHEATRVKSSLSRS